MSQYATSNQVIHFHTCTEPNTHTYVAKIWAQGQCEEQGKLNHIFANIIRSKMNGEDCMYLQGTYKKND